jgi:hypothetical protein
MSGNHQEPNLASVSPASVSPANASPTERRIRRLVVPDPSGYARSERIDFIHDPDTELLWGPV